MSAAGDAETGRYGLDGLKRDHGIQPGKVRSWMRRGHVPWMPKVGKGGRLDLSEDQVVHLIVLNELSEMFMPEAAADYADQLMRADAGTGMTTLEGGPDEVVAIGMNVAAIRRRVWQATVGR